MKKEEQRNYTLADEDIDWVSESTFLSLQEEAPEWLEMAGITSWQQVAEHRRAGTWIHPDYKRQAHESWPLLKMLS